MSSDLWVIRAGAGAVFVDEFQASGYIALGFDGFTDVDLGAMDEASLRARATDPSSRSAVSQLAAIAHRVQIGDLVIVPRAAKLRDFLVGRISGPYVHVDHAPESGPHRRPVEWLGLFRKDDISVGAAASLGSISTVFRPMKGEAELRGILTRLQPLSTLSGGDPERSRLGSHTAPGQQSVEVAVAPAPRPLKEVQLDIVMSEDGRARITCVHPSLIMEQMPRQLDPIDTAGSPGVYVLTGTDLQQATTRPGIERTLTSTFIVKPWAYVGLSEDFRGRLGSHRQSKPEWRRALLVRSGGSPFSSDDIKYLELQIHRILVETGEVLLDQAIPRGNLTAQPRNTTYLNDCAETVVSVLRLTGTLI